MVKKRPEKNPAKKHSEKNPVKGQRQYPENEMPGRKFIVDDVLLSLSNGQDLIDESRDGFVKVWKMIPIHLDRSRPPSE